MALHCRRQDLSYLTINIKFIKTTLKNESSRTKKTKTLLDIFKFYIPILKLGTVCFESTKRTEVLLELLEKKTRKDNRKVIERSA